MSLSELKFVLPKSIDSDASCALYGKKGLYKLSLDVIADGDHDSIDGWIRDTEQFILSDAQKKFPDNPYLDFRELKFLWRPPPGAYSPDADKLLGVPDSLKNFDLWSKQGRYDATAISDVIVTIIAKDDSQVYSVKSSTLGVEETKELLTTYFCGTSHKIKALSFPNWFQVKNLELVRQTLSHAIGHLMSAIPESIKPQFIRGGVENWKMIRTLLLAKKSCIKVAPDILKLRSLLELLFSPKASCMKLSSKIMSLREFVFPYLKNDMVKVDLGEVKGDMMSYSGPERYSPFLNLLFILLATRKVKFETFDKLWDNLARKLDVQKSALTVTQILDNKEFIYGIIDRSNRADRELNLKVFNRAFNANKDDPFEEYARIIKANSSVRDAPQINQLDDSAVEEAVGADILEDQFHLVEFNEDDGFYYQRINRPRNARGFSFNRRSFTRGSYKNRGNSRTTATAGRGGYSNRGSYNSRDNSYAPQRHNKSDERNNGAQQGRHVWPNNGPNRNYPKTRNNWRGRARAVQRPRRITGRYGTVVVLASDYDELAEIMSLALEDEPVPQEPEEAPTQFQFGNEEPGMALSNEILISNLSVLDDDQSATLALCDEFDASNQIIGKSPEVLTIRPPEKLAIQEVNNFNMFRMISNEDEDKIQKFLATRNIFRSLNVLDFHNKSLLRKGLFINCNFGNEIFRIRVILDSGATSSLISETFLNKFHKNRIQKLHGTSMLAKGAAGGVIELTGYVASFTLPCADYNLKFNHAVVTKQGPADLVLFGISDLIANDFNLITGNGMVKELSIQGVTLKAEESIRLNMINPNTEKLWPPVIHNVITTLPDNSTYKWNIHNVPFDKKISNTESSDNWSLDGRCDQPVSTKKQLQVNPDSDYSFQSDIEKIRAELLKINTIADVTIDPLNEVLTSSTSDLAFKNDIKNILLKHKIIFRGECGHVKDDRYVVRGEIKGNMLGKSTPNYYAKMSAVVKKDLITKFNTEIANGILVRPPKGTVVRHILPVFPVGKRGDDGKIVLNTTNIRIVADCSRAVNDATCFTATQADNIREIIQLVAKYTKWGLICCLDISQMFYSFELDRDLWAYFGVEHPEAGVFVYSRLPMGWVGSCAFSREFLMRILYKFRNNSRRYLDDVVIFADTREEFITVLSGVLATIEYAGLRLKGKKMTVLGKTIKLLGKELSNGTIRPCKHIVTSITDRVREKIVTKRQLKAFIGAVAYITDHIPHQADLLLMLRNATAGTLADSVDWTDELIKNFDSVRNITNKILILYPVLPNRPIYGVVDSSRFATGAFFYQFEHDNSKQKRFVKIFSRRRSDVDNKFDISSCQCELNGIICAMTAASVEIESCNEKVTIFTDSKSVADLYKRLRTVGVPSTDRKINSGFAKLMVFNYEIIYISAKELPILAADYVSRTSQVSNDCTGCKICESVNLPDDILAEKVEEICEFALEIRYSSELIPSVSFDEFLTMQLTVCGIPNDHMNLTECEPFSPNSNKFFETLSSQKESTDPLFDWRDRSFLQNFVTRKRDKSFLPNLTFAELTNDYELLRQWQLEDKILAKVHLYLTNNISASNKCAQAKTLMETKRCFLKNGLVQIKKFDAVQELSITLLPESKTAQVCEAAHNSFGHSATYRFIKEINRKFSLKNVTQHVKNMVSLCKDCTFLKNNPKILRPMKNFDDDIPTKIGRHYIIDEITRLKRVSVPTGRVSRNNPVEHNATWRFLIISDVLSRFIWAEPIKGNLTSDALRKLLIDFKFKIGAYTVDSVDISLVMDGCSVHQALIDDKVLLGEKINILIKPRTSGSKNYLAMIDSRIAKFSRLLNLEMQKDSISRNEAARSAARAYNTTPGPEGLRPGEIQSSRDAVTGEQIHIDVQKLITAVKHFREASRNSKEKAAAKTRYRLPIKFVPYEEGMNYTDPTNMPIKKGDLFLLDRAGFDKNETNPWFVIVTNEQYPSGINFDDGLVCARKLGSRPYGKPYVWQLTWIREIVNGNCRQANELHSGNIHQISYTDHFSAFDSSYVFPTHADTSESFLFEQPVGPDPLFK